MGFLVFWNFWFVRYVDILSGNFGCVEVNVKGTWVEYGVEFFEVLLGWNFIRFSVI